MDYDLTQLDHRKFEHLVQALAVEVVAPGVSAFGDGPDNGREATFEGRMNYPSEADPWSGLLVMQAKFRQVLQGNKTDSSWALGELRKELKTIFAPGSKRTRPDYYVFATSVTLSSAAGGGKDQAREIAAEYPLQGFELWDGDQIDTYLDVKEKVRNAFDAFVTPGDVLAELKRKLRHSTPDFERVIARYLERELLADQYANLEQAGKVVEEQIPISRVFVDLPLRPDGAAAEGDNFVASILDLAAQRLVRPEGQAGGPRDTLAAHLQPGRLVLVGGPGQGKTTLGQVLCQLFRMSLLKARPVGSLTPEAEAAIALMESQCELEGIELPTVPRFPVRIALTDLSDRLADSAGPSSLLAAIAEVIAGDSEQQLPVELLREWLGSHPWLLVLDGLDEVPASSNRAAVLKAIRNFWVDATEAKSDLLVVATTRPQGYNDDFSPTTYRHVELAPLNSDQALHYSRRLALAKHPTEKRKRDRINTQLTRATRVSATSNLLTTPLQVTIMATLVDRGGRLPEQKWKLFSEYYRVIYLRELERGIAASQVLSEHQPDIDEIHRRVALVLQAETERASHAEARLSKARFGEIVTAQLRAEGHAEPQLEEIATGIIAAATDRLVFLVGLEADRIGFEIRSLQEFMAAEALMQGSEADVTSRLEAIAGITSWRNVFLFAAGHCFAERRHLRANVNTLCAHLNDAADPLAPVLRPGSELAIDLLEEGVAVNQPEYSRLLTAEAMRLVERNFDFWRLAGIADDATHDVYAEALRSGLRQPGGTRAVCIMLLRHRAARGESWAERILEEEVPATAEAMLEIAAWEEEVTFEEGPGILDRWLDTRFEALLPVLSMAQIGAHRGIFIGRENHIGMVLNAAFQRQLAAGGDMVAPFAGLDEKTFAIEMPWLAPCPQDAELRTALDADPQALGAIWAGASAANAFQLAPTAAELAKRLRELADDVYPGDWDAAAELTSWPLSASIDHAKGDPGALRRLADLAEQGRLGDRADWEAAERRWQEEGVSAEDLAATPTVDAPFDGEIAVRGFPSDESIRFTQTYGDPFGIAEKLLARLDASTHEPTRRMLTRWLIDSIQGQAPLDEPPPAAMVCAHLSDRALDRVAQVGLGLAVGLEWSPELSAEEADALDRIGQRLRKAEQGCSYDDLRRSDSALPLPEASSALLRNWNEGRQSDGLFRILAIGLWAKPQDLAEAPEIASRNPGAAALLELKGDWTVERIRTATQHLTAVARQEPIWLWEAVLTLHRRLDEPLAEQVAAALWEAIVPRAPGDRMLILRRELGRLASQLFDMRSSDLSQTANWKALGFGELPPPGDPPSAPESPF